MNILILATIFVFLLKEINSSSSPNPGCRVEQFAINGGGACRTYPTTGGVCSSILGGLPVFLAGVQGTSFNETFEAIKRNDAFALTIMAVLRANIEIAGIGCVTAGDAWACHSTYYTCNSISVTEGIPRLPCRSFCEGFWNKCQFAFDTFFNVLIQTTKQFSAEDFSFVHCGPNGTWANGPQPPDVFGARKIISAGFFPSGYQGQLRTPVSSAQYTLKNGTSLDVQCNTPSLLVAPVNVAPFLPPRVCPFPFENVNGNCVIPCPFPVIPLAEQEYVILAFEIPALIGLIACVFVILDSLWVIAESKSLHDMLALRKRFLGTQNGENSTTGDYTAGTGPTSKGNNEGTGKSGSRKRRQALKVATLYSLLGALLGAAYVGMGPIVSLIRGTQVSCGLNETTVDLGQVAKGIADVSDDACRSQRASPFILQMIFNLILYAIVRVYLVVTERSRRFTDCQKRCLDVALFVYCAGIPIAFMAAALSLDHLSTDILDFIATYTRNAAICVPRLTEVEEIIFVISPFVVTGILITFSSILVYSHLHEINKNVKGLTDTKVKQNSSATALRLLMGRLSFLGIGTFALTIVFVVSTVFLMVSMADFAPKFNTFLECQSIAASQCRDCQPAFAVMIAALPSALPFAFQICAMSSIVLLFGFFFAAQSFARLYKEYQDGILILKCDNCVHCRPINYRPKLLASSFDSFSPTGALQKVGESIVETKEVVQESLLALFVKKVKSIPDAYGRGRGRVFRFKKQSLGTGPKRKFAFVPSSWNSKNEQNEAPWGSLSMPAQYSKRTTKKSSAWTSGPVWSSNLSSFAANEENKDSQKEWRKNTLEGTWNQSFNPTPPSHSSPFIGSSIPNSSKLKYVVDDDEVPARPPSRCPSI